MEQIQIVALVASLVSLAFAGYLTSSVLKKDEGSEQIQAIGKAIQEGAMAFLSREYRLLAIFVVVMAIVLAVFIDFDVTGRVVDVTGKEVGNVPGTAIAYLVGAIGWVYWYDNCGKSEYTYNCTSDRGIKSGFTCRL